MKKKVLALIVVAVLLVVNMLPSIAVFADDTFNGIIHIEAENTENRSGNYGNLGTTPATPLEGLSAGKMMSMQKAKTVSLPEEGKWIITYNIVVPEGEGGTYSFIVFGHDLSNKQYISNYYVKINDDQSKNAFEDATFICNIVNVPNYGKVNKYDFGTVTLNEGNNKVSFEIKDLTGQATKYVIYMDCFELRKIRNVNLSKEPEQENISYLTGDGQYPSGYTATITAAVKSGQNYVFDKWVNVNDANDVVYSPVHSFTVTSDVVYKAVFKQPQYTVEVSTNDDSLGSVSISQQKASYNNGEAVTLTANANTGNEFICWEDNGKQVTTNPYIINVDCAHNIRAIFAKKEDGKNKVTFKDADGRILKIALVADGESADAYKPDNPSKSGYEFDKWDKPLTNITDDTVINALYKIPATTYNVGVLNGTISGSGGTTASCQFDTKVTVTANTAPTGQKFSHWTKNGQIASYNTSYSFYVSENTTLAAVFVLNDATINKLPCITIDSNPIVKSNEISFIAQCTVDGESYTETNIVEYGVLLSKDNVNDTNFYLGTAGVIRGKAGSKTNGTGQFMITKTNVTPGQTWYGRAYMIYRDGSGNLITIYSNTVSA